MGNDKKGDGLVVRAGMAIIGGAFALLVAWVNPLLEKKGTELAGAAQGPVSSSAAGAHGDSTHAPPRPGQAGSGGAESRAGSVQRSLPSQPPVSPREGGRSPRSIRNNLNVPDFDGMAGVEHVRSHGVGRGPDRSAAIMAALEEATSKQGAQFSAAVRLRLETETMKLNGAPMRRTLQSTASDYAIITDGLIRWWDIESEDDDGEVVSIRVQVVLAKASSHAGRHPTRKSLAVIPFRADAAHELGGTRIEGAVFGRRIRESVVTYLVNSRKFAVVDQSFEGEISNLEGQKAALDSAQRMMEGASKLGIEYVVAGVAHGVGTSSRRVGNLDVAIPAGVVEFRIIHVASRQTVLASAIEVGELTMHAVQGSHPEHAIVDAIGRAVSERTLEAIYPLKVAAIPAPGEVMLNRGGDDVAVGRVLDIFNPGNAVTDPATGESLGVAEHLVGSVEITRVTPKASYAKVIAKTSDVSVGALCRTPQRPKAATGVQGRAGAPSSALDDLFK